MPKHWLTALAVALCCAGLSCNSGNGAAQLSTGAGSDARPATVAGGQEAGGLPILPQLPSPADLAAQLAEKHSGSRRASYVPADLLRRGSEFDSNLDSQRVVADGDELVFSPEFSGNAAGFGGLAYALYSFSVDDYEGNAAITVRWAEQPAGNGGEEDYLALANWDSDRWDWFIPGSGGSIVSPGNLDPYFAFGGVMLACVVRTGVEDSRLDFLRIGSVPPDAQLSASPSGGLPPVTINYDASGSTDSDGTIAEYLWDPEGDGSFSESTGDSPLFSHTYDAAGPVSAAVRVVDNSNVYNDASVELNLTAQSIFSVGQPVYDEEPVGVFGNPDGSVTVIGNAIDLDLEARHFEFMRLNAAGNISAARSWTPEEQDFLRDAARGPDGSIYACGRTFSYDAGRGDAILQKWSPDGELIWSRSIGNATNLEELESILIHGERIYMCGRIELEPDPFVRQLGFMLATDLEGAIQWKASLISAESCSLNDMAIAISLTQPAELRAGGVVHHGEGQYDALYVRFNLDGALLSSQIMGAEDDLEEISAISIGPTPLLTSYVSGIKFFGTGTIGFLSIPGGKTMLLSDGTHHIQPAAMSGRRLLLENTDLSGFYSSMLLGFSSSLELTSQYLLGTLEEAGASAPTRFASYPDGRLVIAGSTRGDLPLESTGNLAAVEAAELSWSAISISIGNPTPMIVDDTPIFTEAIESLAYDRQLNDRDMLFKIGSFE